MTPRYIHLGYFRIFPNKNPKLFHSHFEKILFFKTFQVLENCIINFHDFPKLCKTFQNPYEPCQSKSLISNFNQHHHTNSMIDITRETRQSKSLISNFNQHHHTNSLIDITRETRQSKSLISNFNQHHQINLSTSITKQNHPSVYKNYKSTLSVSATKQNHQSK